MNTLRFGFASKLGALFAVAGLTVLASASQAVAQTSGGPPSDELLINGPGPGGPVVLADIVIPETPGPGTQPGALFNPPAFIGLVPPGALTAGGLPPGAPGLSYVILSEPFGEPIDPTALPPVFFPTANGEVIVSDLLINGSNIQIPGFTPFIALISDNNPDLAAYVGAILGLAVPILPEVPGFIDLTPFMGPTTVFGPIQVLVSSDVSVPEPSTLVLGFAGLAALGFLTLRTKLRRA